MVHEKLPDLRVVKNMHERKALIAELSDGFIALPGGYGTFEEFCEILAWSQLGYHQKPFGLLDVAGFYRGFLEFFDHATREGFIRPKHRELVIVEEDPEKLLHRLETFQPPKEVKWGEVSRRNVATDWHADKVGKIAWTAGGNAAATPLFDVADYESATWQTALLPLRQIVWVRRRRAAHFSLNKVLCVFASLREN